MSKIVYSAGLTVEANKLGVLLTGALTSEPVTQLVRQDIGVVEQNGATLTIKNKYYELDELEIQVANQLTATSIIANLLGDGSAGTAEVEGSENGLVYDLGATIITADGIISFPFESIQKLRFDRSSGTADDSAFAETGIGQPSSNRMAVITREFQLAFNADQVTLLKTLIA